VATTVKKDSHPIVSCVAMMVRFLNAELSKDVQLLRSLGNFTLKAADNQLRCATDLRSCFIMSKGEPDSIQLQQLMHAAFDALLRPSNHLSGQFIACPTNQALLLRSLVDEGKYTTSKTLNSNCAALQWTFQAVLVQVARLRYLHLEQYVPTDPTGTTLLGPLHESGRASHATVGREKDHVSPCPVIPRLLKALRGWTKIAGKTPMTVMVTTLLQMMLRENSMNRVYRISSPFLIPVKDIQSNIQHLVA
jgi:hypothetical protein